MYNLQPTIKCKIKAKKIVKQMNSNSFLQVITIFSASNYYEIGSNKGAYLKLNPQLDTHFVQYTAAASKTRKLTFRQRVGLVESSALRELGARLRERRCELEREFRARDPNNTGKFYVFVYIVSLLSCMNAEVWGNVYDGAKRFIDFFFYCYLCCWW